MIESRLKIYRGLARAGVPDNKIIRFLVLRKGMRVSDLLFPVFFR